MNWLPIDPRPNSLKVSGVEVLIIFIWEGVMHWLIIVIPPPPSCPGLMPGAKTTSSILAASQVLTSIVHLDTVNAISLQRKHAEECF